MTRKVPITFARHYTECILRGEKTVTARYGFEDPVSAGDYLVMKDTDEEHFATAEVEAVEQMTVFDFAAMNLDGHRSYESAQHCIGHLRRYYPDAELTENSDLTVIRWTDAADPEAWRWEVMMR